MKPPIFVRELSESEREGLQAGVRSKDAFVMRRCQSLLASARGESPPKIAATLGCASQTARNAIRAFNQRGMDVLTPGSSTPKRVYSAFDVESAERLRGMLHRSPREFGYESSLWTLEMAAEAAFEEGLTERRVSGETIRATLSRLLGIRWLRAKRWITSPDPLYERKKAARPVDGSGRSRSRMGHRFPGRMLAVKKSLRSTARARSFSRYLQDF
jgi:transposase